MTTDVLHLDEATLRAGLDEVRRSPAVDGSVVLVVARPATGERSVLDVGQLDVTVGLVGDDWATRGSRMTEDGRAHPDMQLNIINARFARLVAGGEQRMPLAGDQLHLDLDLSEERCPPGTRIAVGTAVIEVTDVPHRGCLKFRERFGSAALKLVNTPEGMAMHLRGLNARVVQPGVVRPGDAAVRLG